MLTTQDISWFLDLDGKGQLDLDPPYHGRSAWSPRDKELFIDTILNNYPAPSVFLHKTIDQRGHSTYHVVDGKQRLQTILEFCNNEVKIPDDFGDVTLRGKYWEDLGRDAKRRCWDYALPVEVLPDVSDPAIKHVFGRINRNFRGLTRQEMRHAKYDGWFVRFVEAEAGKPEWRKFGVITNGRKQRMADVQFISELCAVVLRKEVSAADQDDLDRLYANYEDISEKPDFMEDDFIDEIERLKRLISDLVDAEPRLQEYLKAQNHFYTLWAYLTMIREVYPGTESFAPQYLSFIEAADAVAKNGDVKEAHARHVGNIPPDAVRNYAQNTRDACSSLQARKKRLQALNTAVEQAEDLAHENI